jgi:raffinose/stachyose/melibiose transport system substrate-binding protein
MLGEDAANWDLPEVLQAAQMVEQIANGGFIQADYMGTKYPDAQNRWANDEFSFMLNGSYMGGETTKQQSTGFEANTFLFPVVQGGHSTVEVTASGIAASAASKNLDAAIDFLAFAAQKQYQSLYASEAGFLAARADVTQPASLASLFAAIESAEETTGAHDLAAALHPAWWNDILLPLDDKLFSGTITAEEFIAQGKELTTTFLETNG